MPLQMLGKLPLYYCIILNLKSYFIEVLDINGKPIAKGRAQKCKFSLYYSDSLTSASGSVKCNTL